MAEEKLGRHSAAWWSRSAAQRSRFAARFPRIQKRRKCEPSTSQRRLISQRTSEASGVERLLKHGAFGLADQHGSHTGDLWDSVLTDNTSPRAA
ncbi:hypothetical protein AOLI_G00146550 [Acnodon oligacanthus]